MEKRLKNIVVSIVVFATLFALIAPVQAQPYVVLGQVSDTDGNPVNDVNVNVTCIPTGESVSSTTAEGGWYSVTLGNDPYSPPAPGETLRLFADAGDGRTNTTEVPATESPQFVNLILQGPEPEPTENVSYTISNRTITPTPTPAAPTIAPTVTPAAPMPTITPTPTIPPAPTATPAPTPTPTPTEPGFEAVFAIAGLLAVAYLVLRKKQK